MWHTSEKVETFAGALSLVLAYGLGAIIDDLIEFHDMFAENDDCTHIGYQAFDQLTLEQKAWTIHKVAFGLLDRDTPVVDLTAYSEAAVASIFRQVEVLIIIGIEIEKDAIAEGVKGDVEWCYAIRRAVLKALEDAGRYTCDSLYDGTPMTVDCKDVERWEDAIYQIESCILWDDDFDWTHFLGDSSGDLDPDHSKKSKAMFGIVDEYYVAIPDDPSPAEAKKLLKAASKLCSKVIKREERKLGIKQ